MSGENPYKPSRPEDVPGNQLNPELKSDFTGNPAGCLALIFSLLFLISFLGLVVAAYVSIAGR